MLWPVDVRRLSDGLICFRVCLCALFEVRFVVKTISTDVDVDNCADDDDDDYAEAVVVIGSARPQTGQGGKGNNGDEERLMTMR